MYWSGWKGAVVRRKELLEKRSGWKNGVIEG